MKKIKSKTKMKTKMNISKTKNMNPKQKDNSKRITGKESMHEIMQKHPEVAMILMENGMGCCGCPMAANESINDGCLSHGIDPKEIVEKINKEISKEKK